MGVRPKRKNAGEEKKGRRHKKNPTFRGKNGRAQKALLPRYAGKVDVIYIDPPYNTGHERGPIMTTSTRH